MLICAIQILNIIITIPLYIARGVMAPYNRKKLSFAWYQSVFASVSAIFHLLVISLERLHAILRPFHHRHLSLKVYWVTIAVIWIFSLSLDNFNLHAEKVNFFQELGCSILQHSYSNNSIARDVLLLLCNLEKEERRSR